MVSRLGFIGCGWIGRKRLAALAKNPIVQIAALVEPDAAARAAASNITPKAKIYDSYEDLLETQLDGVVVSTPNNLHPEQAERALLRGISVFCQKPIGQSATQTRRVILTAQKMNRLIMTDFCYRTTKGIEQICKLVRAGVLGHLYFVDLTFHNSYGPDKEWYYKAENAGGGCLLDLGIHLIDLALWIAACSKVSNCSSRLYAKGKALDVSSKLEDHAIVSADLLNGTHIALNCSWRRCLGSDATIRAVFHGSQGVAIFENVDGSFYDFRANMFQNGECRELAAPPDDWEARVITEWARIIAHDKSFNRRAFEIVSVAEVLDLIYESAGAPRSGP